MTAVKSFTSCIVGLVMVTGGAALAQSGPTPPDALIPSLNACLSAAAPANEAEFMSRLNPALNDPDRAAWCLFLYVNSNVATEGNNNGLFETWASDGDTFQTTPVWPGPGGSPMALRRPILPTLAHQPQGSGPTPFVLPFEGGPQCPAGQLCVGEETRRNFPTFKFINDNKLFSRDGLRAYNKPIVFPADSIEVKANWVPVSQLGDFLQGSGSPNDPSLYHLNTATDKNGTKTQYALLSFHIISKMVPNWTWATFEHMNNPGRCDLIGCNDAFGANPPFVAPKGTPGTQYPNCTKSPALDALFAAAKIDPAFKNYCLKGTQTDFTDAQGVATRLGNTVTENGFVSTASCITCHGRAAFSFVTGGWASNRIFIYSDPATAPLGPVGPLDPGQFWLYPQNDPLQNARSPQKPIFTPADFVWSLPLCAINAAGASACASK
jgi:hypothetical protein